MFIDFGSEDGTSEVVERWSKKHTEEQLNCRYVYQANRGQNIARNIGMRLARGEYIQFMDSDDLVHPKKVEYSVFALLGDPHAEFVVSRVAKFSDTKEALQWMSKEPSSISFKADPKRKPWFTSMRFESWQATYRRRLLSRVGPMDDIRAGGTRPYIARVKLHAEGSVFLPHVLNFYREGTENAMVRCGLPLRVLSNFKSIEYIKKDLNKFGIADGYEWFNLTRFAFRNYRKAVATGDRELCGRAYTQLQEVAVAWSKIARVGLTLPERVFATIISAASSIRGSISGGRKLVLGQGSKGTWAIWKR